MWERFAISWMGEMKAIFTSVCRPIQEVIHHFEDSISSCEIQRDIWFDLCFDQKRNHWSYCHRWRWRGCRSQEKAPQVYLDRWSTWDGASRKQFNTPFFHRPNNRAPSRSAAFCLSMLGKILGPFSSKNWLNSGTRLLSLRVTRNDPSLAQAGLLSLSSSPS